MALPLILAGIGLGLNALGTLGKAGAQKREAQYASFLADENAELADYGAQDAEERGRLEASYRRMAATAEVGSMQAALGASGVDGQSGSALKAAEQLRITAELDARLIENNAAREAWGLKVDAKRYRRQSKLERKKGQQSMFSTFLGGAAEFGAGAASMTDGRFAGAFNTGENPVFK